VTYPITQADIDAGSIENSATAIAQDPSGGAVSDTSDAGDETNETPGADGSTDGDPTNDPTVTAIGQVRDFTIAKTATGFTFELPGDTATYEYVVTNTGNITLTDAITVTDNLIPAGDISCPALPASKPVSRDYQDVHRHKLQRRWRRAHLYVRRPQYRQSDTDRDDGSHR